MPDHPRSPQELRALDDVELVRLARGCACGGPPERETASRALAVVVLRRQGVLRAVIAGGAPRDVVDDLEAQVWARFTKRVYSGSELTNPVGLLMRMAQRVRADHFAGRKVTEPLEDQDAGADDPAIDQLATAQCVEELLARLSDRQREVVRLRIIEGRSSAEVAQLQGTTPGNIDVIVHRALARLREEAR